MDGEEGDGGRQQQQHQGHQGEAARGAVLRPPPSTHTPGPLQDLYLLYFSFDVDIIYLQFLQLLNIFEHSRVQEGQGVVKTVSKVQAVSTLSHTAVPEIGASGYKV